MHKIRNFQGDWIEWNFVGLTAESVGWTGNKPNFRESSLFSSSGMVLETLVTRCSTIRRWETGTDRCYEMNIYLRKIDDLKRKRQCKSSSRRNKAKNTTLVSRRHPPPNGVTVTQLLVDQDLYCRYFTIILRHATLGGAPLDKWSARRRDLYLTTYIRRHTHTHTHIHIYPCSPARFKPAIPAR